MDSFNIALGQTLIHSLWQGVILAGITGLIIIFTRKAKAANRYLLMVGTMLAFVIVSIGTFCYEFYQPSAKVATGDIIYHVSAISNLTNVERSLPQQVMQYVNNHTQSIVLVWFFIVLARSLQLATGLQSLYHLRRKNLFAVDENWGKRVAILSAHLGINRVVGIAESGIAKVPMVIGHLKPLILIPAGLLTALPPAEIEAILIHELAHIQRRDYLVNLLQSFLEIIFFFNPAVLWLSALIRTERENCCDDIAVEQTSSKVNYIRALVSCQEYQLSAPAYAMAFPGRRSQLMDRVKRMASGTNNALNFRERSILFITLFTAGLLTVAFTNAKQIQHFAVKTQKALTQSIIPATDTIPVQPQPAKKTKVKASAVAQPVKAYTEQTAPVEPNEVTITKQKEMAFEDSVRQSRLSPTAPITPITPITPNTGRTQPITPITSINTKPLSPLTGDLSPYKNRSLNYNTTAKQYAATPDEPVKSKAPSIGEQVTAELIKDQLISSDDKHISFKLSNTDLIVNGIRQTDDVQKRYKDKFVPVSKGKSTWTLYNNYDTTTDDKK
ncbi:M56 family metallopeptidase [Mucilaginibacter rigui]|uniref:M56 family metallopeptidase n=1 Tax=Mucilaginibacter rigui TaxID=534635 RepID=A0ABR7XAD7_9SPHI|nr:M56 family metallopeptidase [Mucilaginibacter rigui]MBD1386792.1 M56 family metallopeptidase [Mucilaginibacter rigui]